MTNITARFIYRTIFAVILFCAFAPWAFGETVVGPGETHYFTESEGCVEDSHFECCPYLCSCNGESRCQEPSYLVTVRAKFLVGAFNEVSGRTSSYNEFLLEGSNPVIVPAIITARVRGSALVSAALTLAESKAEARLVVRDQTSEREVASEEIFSVECNNLVNVYCGVDQDFEMDVSTTAMLTRGHRYRVSLEVYVYAEELAGGVVSALSIAQFLPAGEGLLTVSVGYDPIEQIEALESELLELRDSYDAHGHNYMTGIGAGHNKLSVSTTQPTEAGSSLENGEEQ